MAHYHLCVKVLSRSTRNTVSALAYRAGIDIACARTGESFDYTNKKVDYVDLVLPVNAPQWSMDLQKEILDNRKSGLQKLSNRIEGAEKRVDSQVYREVEFSLPQELSDDQNRDLAKEFLSREFAQRGMGVIANFHFDVEAATGVRKPHCHALVFMRELTETGFSETKNRTWNSKEHHQRFCASWADIQNTHLERHGFNARVDHRSYEARGIDIEPQMKQGKAVTERLKKGLSSFVGEEAEKIQARNLFRINARPELVFDIVTKDHSTFQWADVQKVLHRYADSIDTFDRLNAQLSASKKIVALEDGVYTTKSLLKIEHQTEEDLLALKDRQSHPVEASVVTRVLRNHDEKLQAHGGLTAQQKAVIEGLVKPERVKTLVGYAGAGKSTSLAAAKDIWVASGTQVVGLAPTRKAAQNLTDLDIKSFTVAKFLTTYDQGRSQYQEDTVFLVDEVGLIDSRTLRGVVQAVSTLNAKVVFVGDPRQLQPISAGPVFRRLLEKVPPLVLDKVVRQKEDWARSASQKFGEGKVQEAMAPYLDRQSISLVPEKEVAVSGQDSKDHVLSTYAYAKQVAGLLYHQMAQDLKTQGYASNSLHYSLHQHARYDSFKRFQGIRETAKSLAQKKGFESDLATAVPTGYRSATKEQMVSDWFRENQKSPDTSALMVATTRVDVADLNQLAKIKLQEAGAISKTSRSFQTIDLQEDDFGRVVPLKTQEAFSVGDQIIFKRNDNGLKVDNGMLGRITALDQHKIKVQLLGSDNREISFAPALYPYVKHGWASTIYTTQGATYDRVYALLDLTQNRHSAYVIATRHKDSFKGYAPGSEFESLKKIVDTMAMSGDKLLAKDYLSVIEGDEMKALLASDETLLDTLLKPVQQVKNFGQAVKGFFGFSENRGSLSAIDPSKLTSETESLRAIGLLKDATSVPSAAFPAYQKDSPHVFPLPSSPSLDPSEAPIVQASGLDIEENKRTPLPQYRQDSQGLEEKAAPLDQPPPSFSSDGQAPQTQGAAKEALKGAPSSQPGDVAKEYLFNYIQEVQGSCLRVQNETLEDKALPHFQAHLQNLYQKAANEAPDVIKNLSLTKDPERRDFFKRQVSEEILTKVLQQLPSQNLLLFLEEKKRDHVFHTFLDAHQHAQHLEKTDPDSLDHIYAESDLRSAGETLMTCSEGCEKLKKDHPHAYVQLIQEHGDPTLKQAVFQEMFERARADPSAAPPELATRLHAARQEEATVIKEDQGAWPLAKAQGAVTSTEEDAARCPYTMAYLSQKEPETFDKLTQIRQQELQRDRSRGFSR